MFRSKEEVDAWYESAMDGLGKAGAYATGKSSYTGIYEYFTAAHYISGVKRHMYRLMDINEEPSIISFDEAVKKHL